MSDLPDLELDPQVPRRGRWWIVGGLSLLALPVTFAFFVLAIVAVEGCFIDCMTPEPRPLYGTALAFGAAIMGGGWAGLVPWAMGRPRLIARTFLAGVVLLLTLFGLLAVLG